jgi:PKD repeat protein
MANTYPDDFIPMFWEGDTDNASPGYSSRGGMYGVSGIPHVQFQGSTPDVGGGNTFPRYQAKYNQIIGTDAPISITNMTMNMNSQSQLVVSGDIEVTGNLDGTNNKVVFLLTRHITDEYFCTVAAYQYDDLNLTNVGDTGTFSHALDINSDWSLSSLKAVMLVQNYSGNHKIYQAEKTGFSGTVALFSSDISSGPANLDVNFSSMALPEGNIASYQWDLDGDGNWDSSEENPSFTYTEPGVYNVTLHIVSNSGDEDTRTIENYINVSESSDVSGNVSGTWVNTNNPYIITNDLTVGAGFHLNIEPGVEIIVSDGVKININGLIQAGELGEDPVVFHSNTNWEGLKLKDSSQDNHLYNCVIKNTTVSALQIDNSIVNVIGCEIADNNTTSKAAVEFTTCDMVTFSKNWIHNNTSSSNFSAIVCMNSTPSITNNVIVNNTGNLGTLAFKNQSDILFSNNTIAKNFVTSATNGANVFIFNSNVTSINNILYNSGIEIHLISGTFNASYCDIDGGVEGEGNIDVDPLFTNPTANSGATTDATNSEWFLLEGSPCIDAGSPENIYNDPEDPTNSGYALFPSMGTISDDMGAFGGAAPAGWVGNDDPSIDIPVNNILVKNYPNPFNPQTTISFNLKKASNVNIKIYNVKGQIVRNLINQSMKAGEHNIVWNGKNNNNKIQASGIYFVKVNHGKESVIHKMAMLK